MNTLEEKLLSYCIKHRLTLALAESCTGGAFAARLTKVPGASQYFTGAIVCYQNHVKRNFLKVSDALLKKYGAVSQEVANQMLLGTYLQFSADIVLAITGIAGPTGGTRKTPVGTVYIAFERKGFQSKIIHLQLKGTRESIIENAVDIGLQELIEYLLYSLNKQQYQ